MDKTEEILTRGVANVIPGREQLRKLLASGKKLNVYLGIDPTATQIHLGHAVSLRKLQALANLGHNVTFLIGDFTALIGDTSDKDSERPVLTSQQIEENFQTYKFQAQKVLDFSKVTVRFNSEWLKELSFVDIVRLCQHFSSGDFFSRELIRKRLTEGKHVGLHELLYPVMQGYDSYVLDTDIQLGGTDQTFNMQAGRVLMKDLRGRESYIIANSFLDGTDGRKMSKTWDNAIWLEDPPDQMYGKVMSLTDDAIIQYFTLATNVSLALVQAAQKRLTNGENPMILKKELAFQIVSELHSKDAATTAQKEFETRFQKNNVRQSNLPTVPLRTLPSTAGTTEYLTTLKLAHSKSEARRQVAQGSVRFNEEVITDPKKNISPKADDIFQVGRKAVRITK